MYFLAYVAVVLLLALSFLTATIVYAYATGWSNAEKIWRLRLAHFILRSVPLAVAQHSQSYLPSPPLFQVHMRRLAPRACCT